MSLRLRLILLLLIVYSLGGWLITRWAIGQVRPRYFEAMEETMVEMALLLSGVLEQSPETEITIEQTEALAAIVESARREPYQVKIFSLINDEFQVRVMVADRVGTIVYDSAGRDVGQNRRRWQEIGQTLEGGYGARSAGGQRPRWNSREVLVEEPYFQTFEIYVGAPIYRQGAIAGVVSVGKPTSAVNDLVRSAQIKIFLGMVAGGVALLVVLLLGASWVVGPLERLAAWARAARDGRREAPPRVPGGTLAGLRRAIVEMRDSLEGRDAIDRYTRTLAHEIKAPLTAIRASAELLGEELPPADRKRFEEAIRDGAGRIHRIVDELLALSRLERSELVPQFEKIDLGAVAEEAANDLAAAFEARGVVLERRRPVDRVEARADRALIGRAIVNLLQNALEFAPGGSAVAISVGRDGGAAVVEVRDQGPGIPAFASERVFERFYSLPRPDTQKKSTGLGLSLVREIMELHGGTVAVENQVGGGVRAVLRLTPGELG